MSHVSIVTAAAAFSMSAVLMAGPKFVSTWKAPDAAGVSFSGKKVAALIMSDDLNLRMSGEEALVRELAAVGLPAGVASYRIVPKEELRNPDKAKGWYGHRVSKAWWPCAWSGRTSSRPGRRRCG